MSKKEQERLLSIARGSIARALVGGGGRRMSSDRAITESDLAGALGVRSGAFVTIRLDGDLRGCIGYIASDLSLVRVVDEVAGKAATGDPRFPPLTQSEFARASLEISVLSPLEKVDDVADVQVGRDGLVVELRGRRGLLLPQVATEYAWDRETFLKHTSRKAGLPVDAWKDPEAKIYRFTAEIIEEPATA